MQGELSGSDQDCRSVNMRFSAGGLEFETDAIYGTEVETQWKSGTYNDSYLKIEFYSNGHTATIEEYNWRNDGSSIGITSINPGWQYNTPYLNAYASGSYSGMPISIGAGDYIDFYISISQWP